MRVREHYFSSLGASQMFVIVWMKTFHLFVYLEQRKKFSVKYFGVNKKKKNNKFFLIDFMIRELIYIFQFSHRVADVFSLDDFFFIHFFFPLSEGYIQKNWFCVVIYVQFLFNLFLSEGCYGVYRILIRFVYKKEEGKKNYTTKFISIGSIQQRVKWERFHFNLKIV